MIMALQNVFQNAYPVCEGFEVELPADKSQRKLTVNQHYRRFRDILERLHIPVAGVMFVDNELHIGFNSERDRNRFLKQAFNYEVQPQPYKAVCEFPVQSDTDDFDDDGIDQWACTISEILDFYKIQHVVRVANRCEVEVYVYQEEDLLIVADLMQDVEPFKDNITGMVSEAIYRQKTFGHLHA